MSSPTSISSIDEEPPRDETKYISFRFGKVWKHIYFCTGRQMERPKAATGPVYRRCTPILLAGHTVSAGGYSEFVETSCAAYR